LKFEGGAAVMRVTAFWNATPYNEIDIKNLEELAASIFRELH
jgi:hypothetical protein